MCSCLKFQVDLSRTWVPFFTLVTEYFSCLHLTSSYHERGALWLHRPFALIGGTSRNARQQKSSSCGPLTYPNRVTRPLEEAVMEPSSSIVYSAEMLSCRNRPSGSFFCSAYHFPEYCDGEAPSQKWFAFHQHARLAFVFHFSYPLGVEVLFDCEAVDDTRCRQTALDTGEQGQQQRQLWGSHSKINTHEHIVSFCFRTTHRIWDYLHLVALTCHCLRKLEWSLQ